MTGRTRLAAAILLTVSAVAGAVWVEGEVRRKRLEAGIRECAAAAEFARLGRKLAVEGRPAEGEPLLERSVALLRRVRGAEKAPEVAALLVDLASLRAAGGQADRRAAARALLDEAARIPGLPVSLRARIARDQAALAAMAGDLRGAEASYAAASVLIPGDPELDDRLKRLRRKAVAWP